MFQNKSENALAIAAPSIPYLGIKKIFNNILKKSATNKIY